MDPGAVPSSWQLWEVGAPSFALEVVSRDVGKDHEDAPASLRVSARGLVCELTPATDAASRRAG